MSRINIDEFNSGIFGMKMGNIIYENGISINDILVEANKEKFDHISIKIDTNDLSVCNDFLSHGFYLVDTLLSYKFEYNKTEILDYQYSSEVIIEPVNKAEVDKVCQIAYNSFFNDRFHNDPLLDNDMCNLYYETWIRNSCNGFADLVLVGKDEKGNILGFGTCKYHSDKESSLVLNAVTEQARGKGLYTAMIYEAMKHFKGKSSVLTLGTQINTYAVQKAWTKLGFRIYDSKYVLHKRMD